MIRSNWIICVLIGHMLACAHQRPLTLSAQPEPHQEYRDPVNPQDKIPTQKSKKSKSSSELTKDSIALLPHQQATIDDLLAHPERHGSLIFHLMGTGKTLLAIGYCERQPSHPIVVIAPPFLFGTWQKEMAKFGVKNPKRYKLISYETAPKELEHADLSNTIVILDEAHNLVRYLKNVDDAQNNLYAHLYRHIQKSYKTLALTGTPIYQEEIDFAYLINAVAGKNLLTYNQEEFRKDYSKILRWRSLWRGYLTESLILQTLFPTVLGFTVAAVFASPIVVPIASTVGAFALPFLNQTVAPIERYPLRTLNAKKLVADTKDYISFYEVKDQTGTSEHFAQKSIHMEEIEYNIEQFEFFLDFASGSLDMAGLKRVLSEIGYVPLEDALRLNSSKLQYGLMTQPGAGREIGNFDFTTKEGKNLTAPKFEAIWHKMEKQGFPQTVIYSNYDSNGVLLFARFLESHKMKSQLAVLRPEMSQDEQIKVIEQYNTGKIKILLLHPLITEGISLKNTRQFHVLELPLNRPILDQVLARALRYDSHKELLLNERFVDIYLWKCVFHNFNPFILKTKYDRWKKERSEMSNWSNLGRGLWQVDPNSERKLYSPDVYAFLRLDALSHSIDALKEELRRTDMGG